MKAKGSFSTSSQGADQRVRTNKKTSTRLISLLLSIILVATMVPALAFATGGEEPVNVDNVQGVEGGTSGVDGPMGDTANEGSGSGGVVDVTSNDAPSQGSGDLSVLSNDFVVSTQSEGSGELDILATSQRIADEVTLDKAVTPYEIDVIDADSLLQVYIDEVALLPENLTDVIEEEYIEWGTKDNEKLVLADSVVSALDVNIYELKLVFVDGEEIAELRIKDSVAEAEAAAALGAGIAPLAETDGSNKLTVSLGSGTTWTDIKEMNNTNEWSLSTKEKQVKFDVAFSGEGERSLEITVPLGYQIKEYTVKTGTEQIEGVKQLGLSQEYSDKIKSSVLTDLDGGDWIKQAITGYAVAGAQIEANVRTHAGKIMYTFNSNCDKIELKLTLGLQQGIMSHASTFTLLDAVQAKLINGAKTLETGFTTKVTGLVVTTSGSSGAVMAEVDTSVENPTASFTTIASLSIHSSVMSAQLHLSETFVFTMTYPAGVSFIGFKEGITGITDNDAPNGGNYAQNSTKTGYHLVVENDTAARVLTFTYTNVTLAHSQGIALNWSVDINSTGVALPWDGETLTITIPKKLSSTTGASVNNPQTDTRSVGSMVVNLSPIGWDLKLTPMNRSRWDANHQTGGYLHDYMLGSINVQNTGPSTATDLVYNWTFSPNLAVRSVSFPGLAGNDITNVSASVYDTVTKDTRTVNVSGPFKNRSSSVHQGIYVSATELGLSDTECILSLTAQQETLNAAHYSSGRTYSSASYYGRFQAQSTGTATLTITGPNDYKVTATDTPTIGWETAGAGTVLTTAEHYDEEKGQYVSGSWYPSSKVAFTSTYTAGSVISYSNDVVDPIVIISIPKGITLDTSSVEAVSVAGNNGNKPVSLRLIDYKDVEDTAQNITWTVYRFTSVKSNDMIAQELGPARVAGTIQVRFIANVASSCKAMTLNAQDMVQWDLNKTAVNSSDGSDFRVNDVLNRSGKINSDTSSYYLVTSTGTYSSQFFVVPKPGLNVSLGIRTAGSTDDFYTYDGTDATIAPLHAGGSAEVSLSYVNSSTDNYAAGTEIYLPIPKKAVDYDGLFNNVANDPYNNTEAKDSEFDLSLSGPLSLAGFKTLYTYDTSGDTKDNSGLLANDWTPVDYTWIEDSPAGTVDYAKVTMVKFEATGPILAHATAGTTFTVDISNQAGFAEQNYWRSYQKGWTDEQGAGSWVFGSVLAAETIKAGVLGKVFDDKNNNGVMDTGEEYDNSAGNITALLTGSALPVTLTVDADGNISTPTGYGLKVGDYTVTITNNDSLMEFVHTSATSSERSDASAWIMDIQQTDINTARTIGTFSFKVTKGSSLGEEYLGVGLITKPIITYKAGTGTNFSDTPVTLNYNATPTNAPTFDDTNTVLGYDKTTERWVLDKTVTLTDGTTINQGDPLTRDQLYKVKVTEDITATVSLSLSKFNITYTYNNNNGANTIPSDAPSPAGFGTTGVEYGKTNIGIEGSPTMTGYTFSGWTTSDVTLGAGDTSFTMPNSDVTFTGYWIVNTYDIEYKYVNNPVSGLSAPAGADDQIAGYNRTNVAFDTTGITVEAAPSLTGYTFTGWTISGATLESDGTLTMPDNKVTFTGYWTLNEHAVSYSYVKNAAGDDIPAHAPSTSGFGTAKAAYNSTQNVAAAPSLAGYDFTGWTISGATLNAGGTSFAMPDNNVSFTGSWDPITYNVNYVGNGNTSGAAPASHPAVFGKTFTVEGAGSLTKQGYRFAGWNTNANGSGISYSAGQTPVYTTVGNLTLYAQWDPIGVGYTVEHYVVDANNVARLDFIESRSGITNTTVYAAQRSYAPSHSFSANYSGTIASGTVQADGSLVLRLYYTINTYTVTFLDWNGSVLASRTNVPYGGSALAPTDPVRVGHTFTGWDRAFGYITANTTVNATYTPLTFTVTFVDGQGATLQTSTVNYGGGTTPPANPTRTGYTFEGWDKDSSAWTNVTADATITAQWEPEATTTTTSNVTPVPTEITTTTTTPGSPTMNIFGNDVPLFGDEGSWSLFALLCTIASLVALAVTLILALTRKKRVDEKTGRNRGYKRIEDMWVDEDGLIVDEKKEGERHTRKSWMIICAIVAVVLVVLFVLTQDMTLNMALFDRWSVLFGIGLIIGVLSAIFTFRRVRVANEDEPEMQTI